MLVDCLAIWCQNRLVDGSMSRRSHDFITNHLTLSWTSYLINLRKEEPVSDPRAFPFQVFFGRAATSVSPAGVGATLLSITVLSSSSSSSPSFILFHACGEYNISHDKSSFYLLLIIYLHPSHGRRSLRPFKCRAKLSEAYRGRSNTTARSNRFTPVPLSSKTTLYVVFFFLP